MATRYLKKHNIWKSFLGAESFQSFQKNILRPIYLKKAVQDDIKQKIAVVERLLLHSYYEYEFIDVALTQAAFALEHALKWKYFEVNNKDSKKMSFEELIKWFSERDYFETWNNEVIHQLRYIRNTKAHNKSKTLGGVAFLAKVSTTIDLINDIYEDIELRRWRKGLVIEWQEKFDNFLKNGGIFTFNSKRYIVFKADVIFINNFSKPMKFNILIWPIIDLEPYKNDIHTIPVPIEWEPMESELKANFEGSESILEGMNNKNRDKFNIWKKEFMDFKTFSIPSVMSIPQHDYFNKSLRLFHIQTDL